MIPFPGVATAFAVSSRAAFWAAKRKVPPTEKAELLPVTATKKRLAAINFMVPVFVLEVPVVSLGCLLIAAGRHPSFLLGFQGVVPIRHFSHITFSK